MFKELTTKKLRVMAICCFLTGILLWAIAWIYLNQPLTQEEMLNKTSVWKFLGILLCLMVGTTMFFFCHLLLNIKIVKYIT